MGHLLSSNCESFSNNNTLVLFCTNMKRTFTQLITVNSYDLRSKSFVIDKLGLTFKYFQICQ